MWSAPSRAPDALVHEAIRHTLTELANLASRLLARLADVAGANASAHRALVGELTAQRDRAFAGAYATDYPLLGDDYVRFVLDRLARAAPGTDGASPSPEASIEAFDTPGRRPEELLRAFEILRGTPDEGTPDGRLRATAAALAASAADAELAKAERSGALAGAVFDRIVESDGEGTEPVRGLFGAASLEALGRRLGREVGADEISPVLQSLIAGNLVVRLGYGRCGPA